MEPTGCGSMCSAVRGPDTNSDQGKVIYLVELNNTSYYSTGICIHIQYCIPTSDLHIFTFHYYTRYIFRCNIRYNCVNRNTFDGVFSKGQYRIYAFKKTNSLH